MSTGDPRRRIPSVNHVLNATQFAKLVLRYGRSRVRDETRKAIGGLRERLAENEFANHRPTQLVDHLASVVEQQLQAHDVPSLCPVINATGVILHTNLGRAPLAPEALRAMERVGRGYSNLEFNLESGSRGSRYSHCVDLLCRLTGAEDALVVNNAAAALVLAAKALAKGGGIVISRGELIEIGGGFRIPQIIESAGARLIPVGSTNRTRLSDYADGLSVSGAELVLKVHRSNFRMLGFSEEVGVSELAHLCRDREVPLVHDLGSGLMDRRLTEVLEGEPTSSDSLEAGAGLVVFSGDKLLGGTQAGVIVGAPNLVRSLRGNPLCRALRVDKMTLAGMEATLCLYLSSEGALEVPVVAMLRQPPEQLAARAEKIVAKLVRCRIEASVIPTEGRVGGGSCPDVRLAGWAVGLGASCGPPERLVRRLRDSDPSVVGRIECGKVLLDLRTVLPGQEADLVDRVLKAVLVV